MHLKFDVDEFWEEEYDGPNVDIDLENEMNDTIKVHSNKEERKKNKAVDEEIETQDTEEDDINVKLDIEKTEDGQIYYGAEDKHSPE